MTASRADVPKMTALLAAFAVCMLPFAADAQQNQPLRLSPPKQLQPAQEQAPPAPPEQPKTVIIGGPDVKVDQLQSIDPDTAGTLAPEQGGLGLGMWTGTGRALVERLLPRLPVGVASPTMRNLMRRLLLSTAAAPEGKGSGKVPSLVALRVELLAKMGDQAAVNSLLGAVPGRATNPGLLKLETDAHFLANDNARACVLAAAQIREQKDVFWQKAFAFCQALAGESTKAQLGVSLLSELGTNDAIYFKLMDRLLGGTAPIESLSNPQPLHLAMARAAKVQLPKDVVGAGNNGVLRAIAVSPNAPVEVRLEAAERAELAGALPTDALRQLYMSVSFSEKDLANPLSKAEVESGPLSRALLYRTSLIQSVPSAQAEPVARAFALARRGGRFPSAARVFQPVLQRLPPSAELAWFAPDAVRAALMNNDQDMAKAWIGLLRASALFNKESAAHLAQVMPMARLARSSEAAAWKESDLQAWLEATKDAAGARGPAATLFALLAATGDPVPAAMWEALIDASERTTVAMPTPALWFKLESAAKAGRVGETVLISLLALGEGGTAQADPIIAAKVLEALGMVGLKDDVRALALETAVAAGL